MKKSLLIFLLFLTVSVQAQVYVDTTWRMWYANISDTLIGSQTAQRIYFRYKPYVDSSCFIFYEFRALQNDSSWQNISGGGYVISGQDYTNWNFQPLWLSLWLADTSRLNIMIKQ